MSRCFPYPVPGYQIESIKIRKEKEKSVTECHKDVKKEKKERRKHRKENKDQICNAGGKSHQKGKSFLPSEKKEEAEKSGLTEEHDEPVCLQNICYLSDDGIRSNKKRKLERATDNDKPRNVFRIRLLLTRHKEPDVPLNSEGLCSTSGRADSVSGQNEAVCLSHQETVNSKPGTVVRELASSPERMPCIPVSEKESTICHESGTSQFILSNKKKRKGDSLYKVLIEDWVSPPPQFELNDSDDQEWLFEAPKRERHGNKILNTCRDVLCHESSLFPRGHYLPEADVYALPYTIPF
ncbi:DNA ligase [Salix suchowensis]|nr:DNA ligase [Salix suchowensis]